MIDKIYRIMQFDRFCLFKPDAVHEELRGNDWQTCVGYLPDTHGIILDRPRQTRVNRFQNAEYLPILG